MLKQLYDPIRATWVRASPEEEVRAGLLKKMVEELGFPFSYIAVEKELSTLPHLSHSKEKIPKRRADIICFAKEIHKDFPLYPLLMIECKATPITQATLRQVIGYNEIIEAPFTAVANQDKILTGFYDSSLGKYAFSEGLPSYHALICRIQNN